MTARLMVREADRAGMHLSVRELLAELAGIQETVLLYLQPEDSNSHAEQGKCEAPTLYPGNFR
jgi:hypothetical protein